MKIDFAYGDDQASVIMPPDQTVDFLIPKDLPGFDDLDGEVHGAFAHPIEAPPLAEVIRETVEPDRSVLLIVSDLTRGGGTKDVLPLLTGYVEAQGVARSRIQILVARGTHRKLTKDEKKYFKSDRFRGITVEEHDCDDASRMSALVLTQRGTPVRVNRLLRDAGLVVLVSPVSFHYFAGFGGGRKLVLPGSADRASILANHRLSLEETKPVRLHPRCASGRMDDNPVSDDMGEALAALKNVYGVNFFGDRNGNTVYINAGDAVLSHEKACEVYADTHRPPVAKPYDVAVVGCGGFPYDINLLQAHKSLRHGAAAVNPGGTILFFAQCREGVGSDSFARALATPGDRFFNEAWEEYDLNNQTAVSFKGLAARYRIEMVTSLPGEILDHAGVHLCSNVEASLASALEKHRATRIAVIPYGSQTLPRVGRSDNE